MLTPLLTPPEIAKYLRVSHEKIIGWIRRGELAAVNVGNGIRPRFRIHADDLEVFLKQRKVQPSQTIKASRRQIPSGGPIDPILGNSLLHKKQAVMVGDKCYRICDGTILFF